MNSDLLARIEESISLLKVEGINCLEGGIGRCMSADKFSQTLGAKNPQNSLRQVRTGGDHVRYIPLDGVKLSKIGTDAASGGGWDVWYSVENPDGTSFAIAHSFTCGQDDGCTSYDLSRIPEYLLSKMAA